MWWYTNMFTNSYICVSNIFSIKGPISESALKLISDTKKKIFRNPIFEFIWGSDLWIYSCYLIWPYFKPYLHLPRIKDVFNDFFKLVLVCKDFEPIYERTIRWSFFPTVKVVSSTTYMLSMNHLKHLFIKFSE